MGPVDIFRALGGPYLIAILGYFVYVALASTPAAGTNESRMETAVSRKSFGLVAAAIAGIAVLTHFSRLWRGGAFVPWSAERPWVHAAYGLLGTLAVVVSFRRYRRVPMGRPWLPLGLVLFCIVGSNAVLVPAPEGEMSQETSGNSRQAVRFAQGRLAYFGCFDAARVRERTDGRFDALTAAALISFQLSNGLLTEEEIDRPFPGVLRSEREFRLLASPFPWLGGPHRCPEPSDEEDDDTARDG